MSKSYYEAFEDATLAVDELYYHGILNLAPEDCYHTREQLIRILATAEVHKDEFVEEFNLSSFDWNGLRLAILHMYNVQPKQRWTGKSSHNVQHKNAGKSLLPFVADGPYPAGIVEACENYYKAKDKLPNDIACIIHDVVIYVVNNMGIVERTERMTKEFDWMGWGKHINEIKLDKRYTQDDCATYTIKRYMPPAE